MIKLFISDLHLEESRPDIAALFLKFLANDAKHADALYILGDFFEVWIGDDDLTPFNLMIIEALHKATQAGLPIYILHGNRDFLLGKKFLRLSGCHLLADESVIDLFGEPALLMHGDMLCTEDKAYLKFRKKSRNWFLQKLFLLKSLKTRRAIAERYRKASKMHTSTAPEHIMDVTPAAVLNTMQKHQVKKLIHGHTHRPCIHAVMIDEAPPAQRIVLGPWHEHGSVLVCRPDREVELVTLS